MKWPLLTAVCGVLALSQQAQAQSGLSYSQQIAALHSCSAVEEFVNGLAGKSGPLVHVDSLQESLREACVDCNVLIPPVWVRADLDGDNIPDLLVNGEGGRNVAVLNRGVSKPQVIRLSRSRNPQWCQSVTSGTLGLTPVVRGREIEHMSKRRQALSVKRQDWRYTLMYQLGDFVDYAARPRRMLPRRLTFQYRRGGPPTNGVQGYDLKIDIVSGIVTGSQRGIGDTAFSGPFGYQLTSGQLDTLRQRLRYLRIASLKRNYSVWADNAQKAKLVLGYRYRLSKRIADYGMKGSHSLMVIYSLLTETHHRQMLRQQKVIPVDNPASR